LSAGAQETTSLFNNFWGTAEESSCAKPVGVSLLKLYGVLSLLLPLQLFHRADGSFAKPPDASALLPFITYDSRRKRKNMVQKMVELG
jgi:hypothetical protein